MIIFQYTEVYGWEAAIRGMRNPMNSWQRSDSIFCDGEGVHDICHDCVGLVAEDGKIVSASEPFISLGKNDADLMAKLCKNGPVHAKYRRMINVTVDLTAPLYFWKEFDTYKVGTVANSCSTMHKLTEKEFVLEDFSTEHLLTATDEEVGWSDPVPILNLEGTIYALNFYRKKYIGTKDKKYWWQLIQLLPSSYNQKRTVQLNYEVLANIYKWRKDHKLDEWRSFCSWIKTLPYSELITGEDIIIEEEKELI